MTESQSHGRNSSLPLWKELANPRGKSPSGEDRPSSVPPESQRKIREHLGNVAREWIDSVSEENDDGDDPASLPVFTRTQGQGHPAAWIGGGTRDGETFRGVVLCDNRFCLREPLYVEDMEAEPWKQALVGLGDGDAVIYVEGELPVEPGNDSMEVAACRVKNRREAASPSANGVAEIEPLRARRVFFKVLREHPKIGEGLSSSRCDGHRFIANGEESPDTKLYTGVIEGYNGEDSYGFIEVEELTENVYFNTDDVDGVLQLEDRVQFDLVETIRGPRALNLEAMEGSRKSGIVDWFSERKGYGFISPENDELDDLFVHVTDIEDDPIHEEDRVEFRAEQGDEGPRAVDVRKI